MTKDDFRGKKIAILGVGMEGIAAANFLVDVASKITLCDKLSEEELIKRAKDDGDFGLQAILSDDRFEHFFGESYMDDLGNFDYIFRSPGIPYLNSKIQKAAEAGVTITSQVKLFFDLCPCKIIGVTGTKGKGTTSSLIETMLKNQKSKIKNQNYGNIYLAGNIGKPALTLLDMLQPDDLVILELSSFQLQDIEKSPNIAVIVNMAIDHLDYHKDEDEYFEAKASIVKYQSSDDVVIANKDYANAVRLAEKSPGRKIFFSGREELGEGAYVRNIKDQKPNIKNVEEVVVKLNGDEEVVCRSDEINLVGHHNLENIAAAALAAKMAGAGIEAIAKAAKEFKGLPHRLELVEEIGGVKFYNDSFATNPEPTMAAVKSFLEPITLILGGSSKKADFSELAEEIEKSSVKTIILIGVEGQVIKAALEKVGSTKEIIDGPSEIAEIVKLARDKSKPGSVVLFSPACASFDMFKNYKDRGEKYKFSVRQLI
jgi:UDP-N-acetylmuramoylalanine--D-glutamate ligase